jgi:hypothetical protein
MRLPPFAALITDRPWPPTGLTTARWIAEVPVLDVRLDELHLTQQHVNVAALFGHTDPAGSADTYPHVVEWAGCMWLEDGHNRVVRAALVERAEVMAMRVHRVPDVPLSR